MGCLLRQQGGGRQSRLRVDLQQHQAARFARRVVIAQVRPRCAAATERPVRAQGDIHCAAKDLRMDLRRQRVRTAALGVFGLVVVEALGRRDVGHGERAVPHDGNGQFAAGDVFLHQRVRAEPPVGRDLRPAVAALAHDLDAHGRALVHRLDDVGQRDRVCVRQLGHREHAACGDGEPGGGEHGLGRLLVHGDGRGADAGMGIGNA